MTKLKEEIDTEKGKCSGEEDREKVILHGNQGRPHCAGNSYVKAWVGEKVSLGCWGEENSWSEEALSGEVCEVFKN